MKVSCLFLWRVVLSSVLTIPFRSTSSLRSTRNPSSWPVSVPELLPSEPSFKNELGKNPKAKKSDPWSTTLVLVTEVKSTSTEKNSKLTSKKESSLTWVSRSLEIPTRRFTFNTRFKKMLSSLRNFSMTITVPSSSVDPVSSLSVALYRNETDGLSFSAWPVPDVYEALVNSFVGAGKTVEEAQSFIEDKLKAEERYVLEVY